RFNYQARLVDALNAPLQGAHILEASLWDGGTSLTANSGTKVYSEIANVTIVGGIVNFVVGTGDSSGGPGPLTDSIFVSNNDIFLQLEIDAVVVLPRNRLESVPFALVT